MQIPAHLLSQIGMAAYMVAMLLILTSPVGIVLFVVAGILHTRGPEPYEPVGLPPGLLRRVAIAAALCSVGTIVLAGYHASYYFAHDRHSPGGPFALAILALLVAQLLLVAWLVRSARRRGLLMLWGALWLWVQLVAALVASGGPALGAL